MSETVRVLAVGDPAVAAYTDPVRGFFAKSAAGHSVASRPGAPGLEFDVLPWADYAARLELERKASKPSYDIVMIAGHLWLRDWVEAGALAPLDSKIASFGPAWGFADILPSVRKEIAWKGQTWLLPSFTDGHLVFCDAASAASLPGGGLPPRVGSAWLKKAAAALAKTTKGKRPLVLKAHPSEIFLDWLPYLLEEGIEPFDFDGRPLFNSPKGVAALESYLALRDLALASSGETGNEGVAEALQSGKAKLGVSWGGQAAVIAGAEPGRFVYATLERPWSVSWSFGLLAKSAKKEAALEALRSLCSAEADRAVGLLAGSPVRGATYDDPELAAACPWFPAQRAMLDSAYALPRFPGLGAAMGPLYARLSEAFAGKLGAKAALAAAEKDILALGHSH